MARVRFFAAAAEAAGRSEQEVAAATVADLRQALEADHGDAFSKVLERCSVLVDGVRTHSATAPLGHDTLVDVLPPFAGG